MAQLPDQPDPKKRREGEREPPPQPEQIWPPPASSKKPPEPPREPDEDVVELDWTDEVEKIDEAIEDIRRINGGPAPEADLDDLAFSPPQAEFLDEKTATSPAMESPAPSRPAMSGPSVPAKCKLRDKSEAELGQLWGNIFFAVDETPPKSVIVMGARPGEGATQIAVGLALTGAEADKELRVCLVDFNVRHPQVASLMGVRESPGLTDVLNGRATLDAAIQAVDVRNGHKLYVIAGGPVSEHPLGLLKSRQTQSLIAQLRQRFDHVILDVANAKTYPDPQVLGLLVDGAVLVVKAGDTPRETAAEAKKRLDLAGVRCLGLVLNQRTDPIPGLVYQFT